MKVITTKMACFYNFRVTHTQLWKTETPQKNHFRKKVILNSSKYLKKAYYVPGIF